VGPALVVREREFEGEEDLARDDNFIFSILSMGKNTVVVGEIIM
jgi:hypothetical protein